jgi:allene oxide cyclase-like protein
VRKILVLGVSVVLAAVVIAGMLASGASAIGEPKIFKVEADITQIAQLDLGPAGWGQGDEFVFHRDLVKHGQTIGHDGGVCMATFVPTDAAPQYQCSVTLRLPKGQIATQGLLEIADPASFTGTSAITGGTGAYDNVRGEVSIVQISATVGELTISVTP